MSNTSTRILLLRPPSHLYASLCLDSTPQLTNGCGWRGLLQFEGRHFARDSAIFHQARLAGGEIALAVAPSDCHSMERVHCVGNGGASRKLGVICISRLLLYDIELISSRNSRQVWHLPFTALPGALRQHNGAKPHS
ncbi:hypothetical protein K438DRAFT_275085 [Mycena galopus ATCC 62051]|nr:hypothetical protein K438DRAFT_275085 [Mycena galopus ATCC 62051]